MTAKTIERTRPGDPEAAAPGDGGGSSELALPRWDLDAVVTGLRLSRDVQHNIRYRGPIRPPPQRDAIVAALRALSAALFPAHYGQPGLTTETIDYFVGSTLNDALTLLNEQVRRSLPFTVEEDRGDAAFGVIDANLASHVGQPVLSESSREYRAIAGPCPWPAGRAAARRTDRRRGCRARGS